jgi:hypothetical protein
MVLFKPSLSLAIPGLEWNEHWLANRDFLYASLGPLPFLQRFFAEGKKERQIYRDMDIRRRFLWQGSLVALLQEKEGRSFNHPLLWRLAFQHMDLDSMEIGLGNGALGLSRGEAEALVDDLNCEYEVEGYHFSVMAPDLWLMESPTPWNFAALDPNDSTFLMQEDVLFSGKDQAKISLLQAEIQMMLYCHPINRLRAKENLSLANGLWPSLDYWGEKRGQTLVLSDEWGWLDEKNNISLAALDEKMTSILSQGYSLAIYIDTLNIANKRQDFKGYKEALFALEKMIFSPAWQLWERGHLRSLSLISVGQTGGALRVKKSLGKRIPNRRASYQGLWFGDEN